MTKSFFMVGLVLVPSVAFLGACGGESLHHDEPASDAANGSGGAGGSGPIDAGAPDRSEAPRTSDSGSIDAPSACTGPLEDRYYGDCPATFDGHLETFGCPHHASTLAAAVIDGRLVIYWANFPVMMECVYASANAGAALVGQVEIADSLVYCDRTSYWKLFGSLPDACSAGPSCSAGPCPLEDLSILCDGSSCTCPPDGGGAAASSAGAADAADSGD